MEYRVYRILRHLSIEQESVWKNISMRGRNIITHPNIPEILFCIKLPMFIKLISEEMSSRINSLGDRHRQAPGPRPGFHDPHPRLQIEPPEYHRYIRRINDLSSLFERSAIHMCIGPQQCHVAHLPKHLWTKFNFINNVRVVELTMLGLIIITMFHYDLGVVFGVAFAK